MIEIDGARLLNDLRTLANFGKAGTGVDRIALSPLDIEARRWLVGRLAEAGLEAGLDRVGNAYGRDPTTSRAILIGSHTDTVPMGGWLDGALGVIYALEIARAFRATGGSSGVGIDVISFEDEEGTYLPCLGSRSFCNDVTDAEISAAQSKTGDRLSEALMRTKDEPAPFRLDPARHVAYLEAHIEQGPRLEAAGRRIGIVTGLVGIRRFRILAHGQADHAGTTPMDMRKDAGAALFRLASRIATTFPKIGSAETVWNIGSMTLRPGAANVVPSEAEMVFEFRDTQTATLDVLERHLLEWVAESSNAGPVTVTAQATTRIPPTAMTPAIGDAIATAAADYGEQTMSLPSGAGHDAMVLGRFIPSAMMFVPSIGGRSHDITENTSDADIVAGCRVLASAVGRVIATAAAR
ncbi:MAG: Amidase, hydantoinase/carbamoylase [Xanthobacteraceae bacterium]|nr:Amidase, hydantoinase/carbamoylase [Xanthobacteraceae bacterium]